MATSEAIEKTPLTTERPARGFRTRRRRQRTDLSAHGEPLVWLTGGSLALAVMMIVLLLLLILVKGGSTFWPTALVRITTLDGQAHLGEVADDDRYKPQSNAFDVVPEDQREQVQTSVEENDGWADRRLVRVGNYELSGIHFEWIDEFNVAGETEPEWALVIERLANGRFHGTLKSFVVHSPQADGAQPDSLSSTADKTVEVIDVAGKKTLVETWTDPAVAWEQFLKFHGEVRDRWRERISIIRHENGKLSARQEAARLAMRQAELDHGDDSQQAEEARARLAELKVELEKEKALIDERTADLKTENDRYTVVLETADGTEKQLKLAEVVRAYPANQLGLGERVGVYFSRWMEFLTDEPRESNSEGGVFPAIFGTVVMTLLMSLAVVPFGVLAALFLREYARAGLIVSALRIAINNLAGVPSIVFGVFGLGFFCYGIGAFIDGGPRSLRITPWPDARWWWVLAATIVVGVGAFFLAMFGFGRPRPDEQRLVLRKTCFWASITLWIVCMLSVVLLIVYTPHFGGFHAAKVADGSPHFGTHGMMWASLTLALLTAPVVIVATEEALSAVPNSLREGSYACGASKWQTIRRIVLPRAAPGILTGAILAMARGAGEVAPLMLVGAVKLAPELAVDGVSPFVHLERSFMHLGFHIFDLGFQSPNSEAAKPMVFTTTLLLITLIALLNILAILIRARLRRRFNVSQF